MIKSLISSVFAFIARPKLFVPGLIVAAFYLLLAFFAVDAVLEIIYNSLVLGIYPGGTLLQLPLLFLAMYPTQTIIVIALALFSYAGSAWLIFTYAKDVKDKKAGLGGIISFGIRNLLNIIVLTLFLFLVGLVYAIITLLLLHVSILGGIFGFIALILLLIWFLFGIYLLFKLYFLPAVMAVEEIKLKQALGKTWNWSGKRLLSIILIIIIIEIVASVLTFIGLVAGDLFTDPILSAVAYYPFAVIAIAYSSMVLVNYYNENKGIAAKKA